MSKEYHNCPYWCWIWLEIVEGYMDVKSNIKTFTLVKNSN